MNDIDVLPGQQILVRDLSDLTYQPAQDEYGKDYSSFKFQVSDGAKESTIQQLTFNVLPINDAPILEDKVFALCTGQNFK
ncbi:cadherin-like domain-containing protein [Endozoicomonas sp. Mp262]|uniref:cadherin-like domain-containing protein n=1 Tax=Endozoicomonas sp. Mp262 TaxID=2919499 RepID=UPI0021E04236